MKGKREIILLGNSLSFGRKKALTQSAESNYIEHSTSSCLIPRLQNRKLVILVKVQGHYNPSFLFLEYPRWPENAESKFVDGTTGPRFQGLPGWEEVGVYIQSAFFINRMHVLLATNLGSH